MPVQRSELVVVPKLSELQANLLAILKENMHPDTVVGELNEDGNFLVSLTEDGLTMHGYFDQNGNLIGDWIV